jgi:two-component system sensor histidine kinase PilS (NtrC family)
MSEAVPVRFGFTARTSSWTSLRLLNIFRVGVAAILFPQAFLDNSPLFFIHNLTLYAWTSFAYLLLSLVMTLAAWIERRNFQIQISIQTYIDIVAIILIMHACGGIASGLGMLLIITIAISGLLGRDSLATIFASLASVGLLAEFSYASLYAPTDGTSTQVGLLGAALFATALVTQTLSRRITSSEALIQKQKADVANLAALNAEILQNMQSGVIALDQQDQIRHINDTARKMLGLGSHLELPLNPGRYLPQINRALLHWRNEPGDALRLISAGDGNDNLQLHFQALSSRSHQGTLIFIDDVSSLKSQMQQSKLAALGQLTANIAHEIRNPLAAISHAAQLLAENPQQIDTEKRLTQIIDQHSKRINDIVEDIMSISRGGDANQDSVHLNSWVRYFIDGFCQGIEASPDCFELDMPDDEITFRFDSGHLQRILTNLSSNARLHGSPDHPIMIRVRRNDMGKVSIEVADRGEGIDAQEAEKIFEPFYTSSHRGTGLGLYIVNQLCELNGAEMQVSRNEFGGSSFILTK